MTKHRAFIRLFGAHVAVIGLAALVSACCTPCEPALDDVAAPELAAAVEAPGADDADAAAVEGADEADVAAEAAEAGADIVDEAGDVADAAADAAEDAAEAAGDEVDAAAVVAPTRMSDPAQTLVTAQSMPAGALRSFGRETENPHLQFLVQFEGPDAVRLSQLFREDQAAARAAFAELARANPAFRDLALARMSYGGRATLDYVGPAPTDAATADALSNEITQRLESQDNVRYAEPDYANWR